MKRFIILLIVAVFSCYLAGCSKVSSLIGGKKETTEVQYGLQAVSVTELEDGEFYIKNGDSFFKLPKGLKNFEGTTQKASFERIIAFGQDDANIPTMFKDDTLVYYSKKSQVMSFMTERFKDNGTTLGVMFLSEEGGKYYYEFNKSKTYPGSTFDKGLNQIQEQMPSETILIESVNGVPVNEDIVSKSGTILGLEKGQSVKTNAYIGTALASMDLTADTHFFESFEIYELSDYSLSTEGYAIINLPKYFMSGFYSINGGGVFRYVANTRNEGIAGIDFNTPYFYELDGKTLTITEYEAVINPKEEHEEYIETADATYTVTLDGTLPTAVFKVKYTEKDTYNPNLEQFKAELISPIGEKYQFAPDSEKDPYTMTALIAGAYAGNWEVRVSNIDSRTVDVAVNISTGNANSYIHTGRIGNLAYTELVTYDGPANYNITWENAERAASVELVDPKGKKYSSSETPDKVSNLYGKCCITVDSVPGGVWEFTITGDALGRVWIERENISVESTPSENEQEEAAQSSKN